MSVFRLGMLSSALVPVYRYVHIWDLVPDLGLKGRFLGLGLRFGVQGQVLGMNL